MMTIDIVIGIHYTSIQFYPIWERANKLYSSCSNYCTSKLMNLFVICLFSMKKMWVYISNGMHMLLVASQAISP